MRRTIRGEEGTLRKLRGKCSYWRKKAPVKEKELSNYLAIPKGPLVIAHGSQNALAIPIGPLVIAHGSQKAFIGKY